LSNPFTRKQYALPLGAVVALMQLAAAVGLFPDTRISLGATSADPVTGRAVLHHHGGLASFESEEDGFITGFHTNEMWWASDGAEGAGDPPCLRRPGTWVPVEVGVIVVRHPGGGAFQEVVWLRCL
jgi:hypothetical protein